MKESIRGMKRRILEIQAQSQRDAAAVQELTQRQLAAVIDSSNRTFAHLQERHRQDLNVVRYTLSSGVCRP